MATTTSCVILSFILTETQPFNNYYINKRREWIKERITQDVVDTKITKIL